MLDLLAKSSKENTFLFCTIPENKEIETYPHAAHASIISNDHKVIYAHHSLGLYDLSSTRTLEHFETCHNYYYIITCDAEVGDYMSIQRKNLIRNVVHFYLRNKSEHGILILKMNCCENLLIHQVIGTLSQYCDYYLHRYI